MSLYITKTKKAGSAPGTLVWEGDKTTDAMRISIIEFDAQHVSQKSVADIADVADLKDTPGTAWVNVTGLHDLNQMQAIGDFFGIHAMILEDIVSVGQRPKVEVFEDYVYVVFKMLSWDPQTHQIKSEQVSLIVGAQYVLSFQERPGDVFNPIRDRIQAGKGRIRKTGSGYLAYALIDAVVDHYFAVLEHTGDRIELLEESLMEETVADTDTLARIHNLKRELIYFRKQVWPMREVVGNLMRDESSLMDTGNRMYWSDVHDHTIQVIDTIESFRDLMASLLDLHLSTVSNHMNEVMKVLTIIATIFIPLTFIAGIYGMNFKHMPELEWRYGYPVLWGVIFLVGVALVGLFRRKKWL